jgi:alpha-2-macroglobulin
VRLRITVPSDRHFIAVEDPLPAGLEPIDLSLRTSGTLQPFMNGPQPTEVGEDGDEEASPWQAWLYGRWEDGGWSPWEHKSLYDDRVVYFARMLWPGTYTASYVARATVAGSFVRPPAHAEEMYNPGLNGRSDGGSFRIEQKQ